jgi:hypothetical protein
VLVKLNAVSALTKEAVVLGFEAGQLLAQVIPAEAPAALGTAPGEQQHAAHDCVFVCLFEPVAQLCAAPQMGRVGYVSPSGKV